MVAIGQAVGKRLVGGAPVGRLATVTADGRPHVVPCCFALADDRLYWAVDGKPKSTTALRRLDNIRANPAVSLVVDHYSDDWNQLWWVRLDGTAVIVGEAAETPVERSAEREFALDLLAAKYPQYREQRPMGAVLRVEITGVTGWAFDDSNLPSDSA